LLTSATLVFAAPLGLAIGSFLNVVAYRVPRKESIAKPRSRCTSCEQPIRSLDNVPVVSWLLLRGRCRNCGVAISPRYPAVEALTAAVFATIVLVRGVRPELALELPFAAMLIAVASIDLEHKIVPNKVLLPAAIWAVAGAALFRTGNLPELLLSGGGAFVALLIVALIHPGGMGMGDVKLVGVMGLYLGTSVMPALLIGFLSGTVAGMVLFARYGTAARKLGVPFAPFLALGGLLALLAGHDLIHAYTQTLH
jgi:leader peptidase (prepilin peptidase) / N-methyltransferase